LAAVVENRTDNLGDEIENTGLLLHESDGVTGHIRRGILLYIFGKLDTLRFIKKSR